MRCFGAVWWACSRICLEFEVVGEADDGLSALDLIQQARPDVVLMDVNMPRMDGIQTMQALRSRHADVRGSDVDHFAG